MTNDAEQFRRGRSPPLLGLSPDERSLARLARLTPATDGTDREELAFVTVDRATGRSDVLPIDRMRFAAIEAVDAGFARLRAPVGMERDASWA